MTRRHFINASTITSATVLLNNLDVLAAPLQHSPKSNGFQLLIFATNWGYTGSWEEFCALIKKHGYDGAEIWFPQEEDERKVVFSAFKKHNLKYGFLIGSHEANYNIHVESFKKSLQGAASYNPVYINCHSGRDHFSFDQNKTFIELTNEVSIKTNIPVYHETHRSRILYAAPIARNYFEKLPSLQITLDISHWCNVHESFLEDQKETVDLALQHAGHIHARIGHPEGPQVSDPRAPEWKKAVDTHFDWWDVVVQRKRSEGKLITFLTEFGPNDYMPSLPYTKQPLADQWDINVHMLKTLRARYV